MTSRVLTKPAHNNPVSGVIEENMYSITFHPALEETRETLLFSNNCPCSLGDAMSFTGYTKTKRVLVCTI